MHKRYLKTSRRKIIFRNDEEIESEEERERQELIEEIKRKTKITESKQKQLEELQEQATKQGSKVK